MPLVGDYDGDGDDDIIGTHRDPSRTTSGRRRAASSTGSAAPEVWSTALAGSRRTTTATARTRSFGGRTRRGCGRPTVRGLLLQPADVVRDRALPARRPATSTTTETTTSCGTRPVPDPTGSGPPRAASSSGLPRVSRFTTTSRASSRRRRRQRRGGPALVRVPRDGLVVVALGRAACSAPRASRTAVPLRWPRVDLAAARRRALAWPDRAREFDSVSLPPVTPSSPHPCPCRS